MSQYGSYIRQARLTVGVSLRDAATLLGVSPSYLSEVERGRRGGFTQKKHIDELVRGLGLDRDKLDEYYWSEAGVPVAQFKAAERERCAKIAEGFVSKYQSLHDDECRGGNELHSPYGGPLGVCEQILAKIRGEK